MNERRRYLPLGIALALVVIACRGVPANRSPSGSAGDAYDPVTMDPPARDSAFPAQMAELAIESAGARLNGILYVAAGRGPHPIVLLLHGNPGNERNLDLAQAIRRAGYSVLFFNYRGSWGSGGTFSRTHALEDVHAALRFARSRSAAARFRIDTTRVTLVGHSMGGWLALMTAAADPRVKCVAGIDSRNTGAYARVLQGNRTADSAVVVANDSLTTPGAPYRADGGGAALVAEMKANADQWDLTAHARALSDRPVLLIGSALRTDHEGMVGALNAAGARRVTALIWDTDHSFSDRRIALARTVVDWLRSSCT